MIKERWLPILHFILWLGAILIIIQLIYLIPSIEQEPNAINTTKEIEKIIETKINIIKAIGVIIAAMLASTGVMLTIKNTNRIEKDKVERNIMKFHSLGKKLIEIIVERQTNLEVVLQEAERKNNITSNTLLGLAKNSFYADNAFQRYYRDNPTEINSYITSIEYIHLGTELPKLNLYLENILKILVEEDSVYSKDFNTIIKKEDLPRLLNKLFDTAKAVDDFNKKINIPITLNTNSDVIVSIFYDFRVSQKELKELKSELEKILENIKDN